MSLYSSSRTAVPLTIYLGLPDVGAINPLDWTPFLRGLFVAGLQWCDCVEPPPSVRLGGHDDKTFARDAKGNALIRYVGVSPVSTTYYRHPEGAVGPGQYFGLYPSSNLLRADYGGFVDPSFTFTTHNQYVAATTAHANVLRDARYILPSDAAAIVQRAQDATGGGP
jgi:hypothetical protein